LKHIDYINIDAEGFDWFVIDGMEKSLKAGIIDMLSFEGKLSLTVIVIITGIIMND
jgi:hypothetical protein